MRLCSSCNFVTVLGLALGGRRRHHAHDARRRLLPLTRRRAGILRLRNGVERCLRPLLRLPTDPGSRASAIQNRGPKRRAPACASEVRRRTCALQDLPTALLRAVLATDCASVSAAALQLSLAPAVGQRRWRREATTDRLQRSVTPPQRYARDASKDDRRRHGRRGAPREGGRN